VLLGACAAGSGVMIVVPPLNESAQQSHTVGKFVWYDLITGDVDAVKKFYGGVFGWEFEGVVEGDDVYTLIRYKGEAIGGIIDMDAAERIDGEQWVSYLSVADVDAAVALAKKNGGKVLRDPFDFKERGRVAVVTDPQGALMVLVRSTSGDPPDMDPPQNTWLWTELFTSDVNAAASFYSELAGYNIGEMDTGVRVPYFVFETEDEARAGMLEIPEQWEGVTPNWLPYIRVEDAAAVAAKVEALGGKLLLAPSPDVRSGSAAIIMDPTGGVLAIQKWPIE
jgi:predicted enzyme related to lactoylglutathione lyase